MIYLGCIITFVIPIIWCMFLLDTDTKIFAWERKHHALSVWAMRICIAGGTVLMAIGGVKKYGWIGILLPALIWGYLLLAIWLEAIVKKKKQKKE